jgi:hypothetical protein
MACLLETRRVEIVIDHGFNGLFRDVVQRFD